MWCEFRPVHRGPLPCQTESCTHPDEVLTPVFFPRTASPILSIPFILETPLLQLSTSSPHRLEPLVFVSCVATPLSDHQNKNTGSTVWSHSNSAGVLPRLGTGSVKEAGERNTWDRYANLEGCQNVFRRGSHDRIPLECCPHVAFVLSECAGGVVNLALLFYKAQEGQVESEIP